MKYRIGDVSKILKISDQMIRYYEKCGVITPKRSGDGNYRYYTDMDIFQLFDAMRYKEWNINIAEISDLISNDYYDQLSFRLRQYEESVAKEIQYKTILKNRIEELRKKITSGKFNIGRYWADIIPEHYMYYMGVSHGDEYDISDLDGRMADQIYSSELISFFDVAVEYEQNNGQWWYSIQKEYHDALNIRDYGKYKVIPETLCLNTIVDMGEPGEFSEERYKPLLTYAKEHDLSINDHVNGVIIGRGMDNDRFCRLMLMNIPVRTL